MNSTAARNERRNHEQSRPRRPRREDKETDSLQTGGQPAPGTSCWRPGGGGATGREETPEGASADMPLIWGQTQGYNFQTFGDADRTESGSSRQTHADTPLLNPNVHRPCWPDAQGRATGLTVVEGTTRGTRDSRAEYKTVCASQNKQGILHYVRQTHTDTWLDVKQRTMPDQPRDIKTLNVIVRKQSGKQDTPYSTGLLARSLHRKAAKKQK